MPDQTLSTRLQLDAVLTSGYKDAFSSANDLMSDLKKEGNDLRKELKRIGKEADEIEKVGASADDVRRDMKLLERQIDETTKATAQFGNAKRHFRNASIGARAFKSDIGALIGTARNVSLAIGAIGAAVTLALSPSEELQQFDQTLAAIAFSSPDIDTADIERAKMEIRELSNVYGVTAAEIAMQHRQLTRNLGFDEAQQTIRAAVEFQAATGLSITAIEEELATARISLGIDTSGETRQFLELLQQAHTQGIKIDNIDLGDLETLVSRTGEDVFGENFQREFLTTIAFRQVDSFQFADYAAAFEEEFGRAVTAAPQIDLKDSLKETMRVGENLAILERFGLRAEDGILGAMRAFQLLTDTQRSIFREQLSPVLGEETVEIIGRGSEALPRITQQVDAILNSERGLTDAADAVATTWSGVWQRIGITGTNAIGILQEQFASVFGDSLLQLATRFFTFISSNQQRIRDFFTGIRDEVSPVIHRIWTAVKTAFPVVREFAMDVWAELSRQLGYVVPIARAVGDTILNIARAIGSFLKEHPRLVATVLTGVIAWKAYQIAAGGIGAVASLVAGASSLMGGHIHRLNAMILGNARLQGTLQTASLSVGKALSGIGKAALGAIPGISVMGGSLTAAIIPALPIILPVVAAVAALGAAGYIVYRNWEPIKAFFVDHFETIRTALLVLFPPLGLMVAFASVIKQNWEGVKEFFATLWETVKLSFMVAFEAIKFVALNAVLVVTKAWSGITSFFGDLWRGIHDFFIATPLAPVFEWMVNGVKAVVAPLISFFNDFWDNLAAKAGEVLGWITDKFKALNDVLGRALGWLRDRNEEIQEEIKLVSEVSSPVTQIPVTEIAAPTIDAVDLNAPDSIDTNIAAPELPDVGMDTGIPVSNIAAPSTPKTATPRATAPVYRSPELINIGLGQLSEARKQTLLLADINNKEIAHGRIETVKDTIVPEMVVPISLVDTPQVGDAPEQMVDSQPSGPFPARHRGNGNNDRGADGNRFAESHAAQQAAEPIMFPEVVVIASPTKDEVIHATDTVYKEVVKEVAPVEMETLRTASVEMVGPVIEMPEVVPTDAAPVVIDTPVVETGDVVVSNPAQAEMVSPELVVPIIDAPDVEVPTLNTVVESSAIPEIQSPMVNVAATEVASPSVDVSSPVVDVTTPSVEVSEVTNGIESATLQNAKPMGMPVPSLEVHAPVGEVDMAKDVVDEPSAAISAIEKPIVNIEVATSSVDVSSPIVDVMAPTIEVPEVINEIEMASATVSIEKERVVERETRRPENSGSYGSGTFSSADYRSTASARDCGFAGSGVAKRGRVESDCRCDGTNHRSAAGECDCGFTGGGGIGGADGYGSNARYGYR